MRREVDLHISRNDRTNEGTKEVSPAVQIVSPGCNLISSDLQVKSHPQASLMHEHNISYHHGHETFIRARSKTTEDSCSDKAAIAGSYCLPNIGQYTDQSANENNRASPEDVAERNNDEIRVAKGDCGSAK